MYTSQRQFDAAQSRYENLLPEDKPEMFVGYFTNELTDKEIERLCGPQYTIAEDEESWQ